MLSLFGSRRSCRLQSSICCINFSHHSALYANLAIIRLRTWKLFACLRCLQDRISKTLRVRQSHNFSISSRFTRNNRFIQCYLCFGLQGDSTKTMWSKLGYVSDCRTRSILKILSGRKHVNNFQIC